MGNRVTRLVAAIEQLPPLERAKWSAQLKRVAALHRAELRGRARARVSGESEGSGTEWDLQVANWLDRAYEAVSDRVEEVATKGANVAREATSLSVLPVLLVVSVIAAVSFARQRSAP